MVTGGWGVAIITITTKRKTTIRKNSNNKNKKAQLRKRDDKKWQLLKLDCHQKVPFKSQTSSPVRVALTSCLAN